MTDMFTGMPFWWTGANPMNVVPPNQALANTLAQNQASLQNTNQATQNASAQSAANSQAVMDWSRGVNDNVSRINSAYIAANLAIGNARPVGTYNGNALSPFATGTAPIQHLGGTNGLQPFNPGSYYMANPDVFKAGADPWQHYNQYGQNEGRTGAWGNTTFDTSNYLANNPDVWAAGADPMQHWLMSGYDEGRTGGFGGPDFNEQNYLANNPDVFKAGADPIQHWLTSGQQEGRTGGWGENPFNAQAYSQHNPDVAAAGMDPTAHWLQFGNQEGRQGGWGDDAFNPQEYLLNNRDVAAAGVDPLQHWMTSGYKEGRQQAFGGTEDDDWSGYFSQAGTGSRDAIAAAYLANNRDVFDAAQASGRDPTAFGFEHLMNYGQNEDRGFFDEAKYLQQNPDVAAAGVDPTAHWFQFGQNEGRTDPTTYFNYGGYLAQNPDVLAAGMDPMTHWLQFGANEGRGGGYEWGSQNRAPGTASEILLADQRTGFAAQARKDPNLMFKLAAKAMQEDQNSPEGRTAVIEAMLNRMNATGQNPLNPAYYPKDKVVYNAEIENRLRNNPALLQQVIGEVERAFGGSNIAKYGTNWSSGDTWKSDARYVTPTQAMGANQFYIKDLNTPDASGKSWAGPGVVSQNKRWFQSVNGVLPY